MEMWMYRKFWFIFLWKLSASLIFFSSSLYLDRLLSYLHQHQVTKYIPWVINNWNITLRTFYCHCMKIMVIWGELVSLLFKMFAKAPGGIKPWDKLNNGLQGLRPCVKMFVDGLNVIPHYPVKHSCISSFSLYFETNTSYILCLIN